MSHPPTEDFFAYHKRGFSVIPIQAREKKPLIAWESYQTQRSTEEEIRAWWAKWPEANVGIVTGAVSGLVVIDLDSMEAKDKLKELLPYYDLTTVPRSRTGKGWQLFFKHPGVPIPNRAGVIPGLDVRGDGGYVVAPPSIHPNGKAYKWEVPINGELPKLPGEFYKLISSSASNGNGYREKFNTAQALAGVPEGQRDDSIFRLACKLRGADVPEDMAQTLILEAGRNCEPPFSEGIALEKVERAYRKYEPGQNGNGAAYAPPLPPEADFEGTPTQFPEVAWTGLFREWRDIVAPCTEAALENLWGAFLLAIGMVIGRNAWIESPWKVYPNFYLLLIGLTGNARKSTVLRFVFELLNQLGEEFETLSGIVSTEGIFERLAKKEGTRAIGYADEFRSLLSVAKRKGTQDILPKLNSLYQCPEREGIDRKEKSTVVVRPFFSLLTATSKEYVEDLIGNVELVGGTLNRFIIISGAEQEPKPIVKPPEPHEWERIVTPLKAIRTRIQSNPLKMAFDGKAEKFWCAWYLDWMKERQSGPVKVHQLTARTFEHIQKIALVYSVLAGEDAIGQESLLTAINVGTWLERNSLRVFGDVGLDYFSKAEKDVLDILRKTKKRMWRRDLQRLAFKKNINGEQFGRVLRALESNDRIGAGVETSGAGQHRPWVAYMGEQLTP